MSGADRTMEAYNEIAPVYEEYSSQRQAYLDAVDAQVMARLTPGMRWMDVGAGDGRRLAKIRQAVGIKDIVAVEPSPGMAKICREKTGVDVHEIFGEKLDEEEIGSFDVVTALWNVFGHISSSENRLKTLRNMAAKLSDDGIIMLDVNNRHNAVAYGKMKVLGRVVIDTINFDETRGDASYEWKIGDKSFQNSGHLFIPQEIEKLFKQAGLEIAERFSLNYATGEISKSPYKGQLFYILRRSKRV